MNNLTQHYSQFARYWRYSQTDSINRLATRLSWLSFLLFLMISFVPFQQIIAATLTLNQVIESTNQYYPEIIAGKFEVDRASGEMIHSMGAFDPTIDINQRSDPAGGYKNNYIDNQLTIPTLYHGLKLFTGYRIGRGDFQIWDQYYLTNSGGEYRAGLELPIFRNNEIDEQRTKLITSQESIYFNELKLKNTRLQGVQQAIVLYWNWVDMGFRVTVYEHLLALAKVRQNAVKKRVEEGDLADIDLVENEQFIVQRQQLLTKAQLAFRQAAINLSLFNRDNHQKPVVPSRKQLPKFGFIKQQSKALQPIKSGKVEINCHPALAQWAKLSAIQDALLHLASNQRLPLMNLRAYTSKDNGRGVPRKVPQAARVSVDFQFPINMRKARGDMIRAKAEMERINVQQKFTYDKLFQSLLRLDVSQRLLRRQFALANKQLSMAQKIQAAEMKRFKAGGSSLFLVNQWEQNTVEANLALIDNLIAFRQQRDLVRYFISPYGALEK